MNNRSQKISIYQPLVFICIGFAVLIFKHCKTDEEVYNSCKKRYQLEILLPATSSLDWVPFNENKELFFSNAAGKKMRLKQQQFHQLEESKNSHYKIPCPRDSMQFSSVYYSTHRYVSTYIFEDTSLNIQSLDIFVDVLLDELTSNLDKFNLLDVLEVEAQQIKPQTNLQLLEIPILDRGYHNALLTGSEFYSSLILNQQNFTNVFVNYENSEQIKIYYSPQGLVAFEIEAQLYTRLW